MGSLEHVTHTGSSPRMRGKRPRKGSHCRTRADHPRACGANEHALRSLAIDYGSSPRMRGKLSWCLSRSASRRIIPAHAGQTFHEIAPRRRGADHPRACGANKRSTGRWESRCGSSPRMRGKQTGLNGVLVRVRIIPAHAGQTWRGLGLRVRTTDHPRACGANRADRRVSRDHSGSSPRMRGKP